MAPTARQSKQPTRYTLYGVLYYHGVSASEGHYTIDVLCPNGNNEVWLHFNDETVSAVRQEDVFKTYGDEGVDDVMNEVRRGSIPCLPILSHAM